MPVIGKEIHESCWGASNGRDGAWVGFAEVKEKVVEGKNGQGRRLSMSTSMVKNWRSIRC